MFRLAAKQLTRAAVVGTRKQINYGSIRLLATNLPKIYKSPLPDIVIPEIDMYTFLLDRDDPAHIRNKPAAIDGTSDERLTFDQYRTRVDNLAGGLLSVGIKAGDVIALFAPNHIEYGTVFLAAARINASITAITRTSVDDELRFQLNDSGAKILITVPELLPQSQKAMPSTKVQEIFLLGHSNVGAVKSVEQIFTKEPLPAFKPSLPNDELVICYSSGTTGRPKGTLLTHRNIISNVLQICEFEKKWLSDRDVFHAVLPLCHIYGMTMILLAGFHLRATTVYQAKFDLVQYLNIVQKYKVTIAHIVPPIILALVKESIVSKFDLSSIRVIISGAAPLGPDLQQAAANKFSSTVVKQGYGMSETSPVLHINPADKIKSGSIGVLIPNCEAMLVDPDTGLVVEGAGEGEMWVRGPNIMKGYLNNPRATAETITSDGWLKTGDICRVDEDGHFFVTERLKELIKYKGLQVSPAEIEGLLLSHPDVMDCAVISQKDVNAGEVPKAFVVLRKGVVGDQKAIADFIESKVAPHKKLRGGVEFVDAIPKSATGKILRRVLRKKNEETRAAIASQLH